jgi:hypothetical protein
LSIPRRSLVPAVAKRPVKKRGFLNGVKMTQIVASEISSGQKTMLLK